MPRVNDPYERQHIANLAKYGRLIDEIFRAATREAAAIGSTVSDFDPSRVFSFDDYPITHERVRTLLSRLQSGVETAIVNGVEAEWTLANNKCSALSQLVFGNNIGRLTQAQYRRYFSSNDEARQAFLARKEQGLNLSERVWRYANDFRKDIELGLDVGIRSGLDADAMSRELRTFLQQPERLFRRVRDEHGNLVLSQRASEYHPGQGVYRSSYKNARRLAVTETNMAYRTAEYDRIQGLDFVVGIEIRLSNNHTCNGIPLTDICDDLKGRYPKDFKFTGWHPNCRCHVITILKTEAELMEENRAILAGEEPSHDSVNAVSDVPDNFKDWIVRNEDRIKRARSIPYFMRDNGKVEGGKFELKEFGTKSIIQKTGASEFDVRRDLARLYNYKADGYLNIEVDLDSIAEAVERGEYDEAQSRLAPLVTSAERHAARTPDDIRRIQDMADLRKYGQEYVDNVHIIENELGIKRGKRMTHEQANTGRVNPNYEPKTGFDTNCSTCSATYILRSMGFDVQAKANIPANKSVQTLSMGMATWRKWKDGEALHTSMRSWMDGKGYVRMTATRYVEFLTECMTEEGIYEFNVGYKGGGGHSTLLRKLKDGTIERIEQQCFTTEPLFDFLNGLTSTPHLYKNAPNEVRGIMRVDNALFDALYSAIFEIVK